MIQSLLFFAFGALAVLFLALLITPLFTRRAARLVREELMASLPLSINELQSEKDRLRADFAAQTRRVELDARAAREEATGSFIAIERAREDARQAREQSEARGGTIAELEAERENLRVDLAAREEQAGALQARLAEQAEAATAQAAELEALRAAAAPVPTETSERIDPVSADEASGDVVEKTGRTDAASDMDEDEAASTAALEERVGLLQNELAEAHALQARLFPNAADQDPAALLAKAANERDRLERRIATLMRENRRLRERADAAEASSIGDTSGDPLREQMLGLAAQVAALTARLEGPDSPIPGLLGKGNEERGPPSLADRIRALLDQAPPSSPPPAQ